MDHDSDGIEEAFEGQLRVMLTAAGQVGERIARMREEALRRAASASEQEARALHSRLAAERDAARAALATVHRPEWWDRTTPEQIGRSYELARAWAQDDPEAARAELRIQSELRARYGIGPDALLAQVARERAEQRAAPTFSVYEFRNDADSSRSITKEQALVMAEHMPADAEPEIDGRGGLNDVKGFKGKDVDVDLVLVSKWPAWFSDAERVELARIEQERNAAAGPAQGERARAAAENVEAAQLVAEAETADRLAEESRQRAREQEQGPGDVDEARVASVDAERHERSADDARGEAAPRYDSAERREATAAELAARGLDSGTVDTRMRADVSQARPATEAVAASPGRAPKARKGRGRGPQAQRTSSLGR